MSQTIVGLIFVSFSFLWKLTGWEFPWTNEEFTVGMTAIITLAGIAIAWYARWKRGDIYWWGGRKGQ